MQALLSAARSASSPAVRRSLAQAVAAVAKTASESRTAKLIADAVQLYSDPGGAHASIIQALRGHFATKEELLVGAGDI